MSVPAISFRHAAKRYAALEVLRDFTLDVADGELLTVIGASGCGKTTVLKMINGLILADGGHVLVQGADVCSMGEKGRIRLRRSIGYAIQGIGLFPHLTVESNIGYVLRLIGTDRKTSARRARELCAVVGLDEDLLARYPAALSGGQQQRVGIVRALAASPRIMLMDEPFGAVDAITRAHLQDELRRIHAATGITIVFVTHDVDEALKLGQRVLVMADGGIQQVDAPGRLLASPQTPFVADLLGAAASRQG